MTDSADIVERLAKYATDWRDRAASKDIVDEAAAAITALRQQVIATAESAAVDRASLTQRVKEVVDAAIQLSERAFDSYKAGNGRMVSIQGDDGEKCWIVHSDDLHALKTAARGLHDELTQETK